MSLPVTEIIDTTLISISVGVLSVLLGILGGAVKIINYLHEKFNEVEDHLENLLRVHEHQDQQRHEDNIEKFTAIETQLDIIIKNGNH